ncbi:protoheme IX farnesyltransferase [Candidatus Caldarchaeum subterraneum]|uniref:Protoheme IX farnesyltransferase n=1 Tax=Caldiarchaeum subterraneum TaxID=311458 RepID=E6N603_CALS0|nr:protoheme IX farnesyltransferase [Candidatus Caldarchaeum subterraneum]BAJ49428.1 protoheme IX farnesyltransferase [Candidatus Caldarchaeum subterraneum]BAJ50617.1 protoheme IX farnesyltransferase [Candidatus Caldarchaeum subterraneum]
MNVAETVRVYFSLTKPNVWWLLAFTGAAGIVAASNGLPDPYLFTVAILSITLGVAGTEAASNYLELSLDSVMKRTSKRVLPRGLINPPWKALVFGLVLMTISLILAYLINPVTFFFMATGMFDYLVVYVMWSKRRTPLNIILGSYAGGAPLMAGYTAVSYWPTAEAFILAALIVLWIPPHIWSLALIYKEDYMRAHVPMLPVVTSEATAIRCISSTTIISVLFTFLLYFLYPEKYGLIYLVAAALSGLMIVLPAAALMVKPNRKTAYLLFKTTSPQLFIIMLAVMLDTLF